MSSLGIKNQFGHALAVATALMLCPTAGIADSTAPLTVKERTSLNRKISALGNAATVGIYCKRGKHETYFGTGAVITRNGYILTSTTVVPEGATDIEIFFTDRKKRLAKIIEMSKPLESTLLKVEGVKKLPCLSIAQKLPAPGEKAYTFGNANSMIRLGEGASFSAGVISGVYEVKSADSQSSYQGLAIETDAAINPGQDGGPLLNASGQLAGIISLSYSKMRWQGMAVPMTRLSRELKAFKKMKTSGKIPVRPPPVDTAQGNKLVQAAQKLSKAMVSIEVERTYPSEKLPLLYLPTYMSGIKNFDELSSLQRVGLMREFSSAERTFEANRQLRRPDGPVTGMLVSKDGLIVTSVFNLNEDKVMMHKTKGLEKVVYKGRIQDFIATKASDYRTQLNKIKSIQVTLPNGKRVKAKVLGRNNVSGLALLQAEAKEQPFVELSTAAGEITLGSPIGVLGISSGSTPFTINTGVISAEDRSRGYRFQFDAMINYGNSGGPVFTEDGKICGFVANPMSNPPFMGRVLALKELQLWRISLNGGVSFGGRIDKFLKDFDTLKAGKDVKNVSGSYLGISPNQQSILSDRVIVGGVGRGSPAAKADIRVGDQILSVDDVTMSSWKQLIEKVSSFKAGTELTIRIKRFSGKEYLQVGEHRVANQGDLNALFKKLKVDDELKAKYVKEKTGEMDVDVKLEARK